MGASEPSSKAGGTATARREAFKALSSESAFGIPARERNARDDKRRRGPTRDEASSPPLTSSEAQACDNECRESACEHAISLPRFRGCALGGCRCEGSGGERGAPQRQAAWSARRSSTTASATSELFLASRRGLHRPAGVGKPRGNLVSLGSSGPLSHRRHPGTLRSSAPRARRLSRRAGVTGSTRGFDAHARARSRNNARRKEAPCAREASLTLRPPASRGRRPLRASAP